jgi:signal transduction histidine kinase/CheY-like chemotaxis protein
MHSTLNTQRTLTSKVLALFGGGLLVFVVVTGVVQYRMLRSQMAANVAATAGDMLETIDAVVGEQPHLVGTDQLRHIVNRFTRNAPTAAMMWVSDPNGKLVADSDSDVLSVHEGISRDALAGSGRASQFLKIRGQRYFVAAHVVRRADNPSVIVGVAGITIPLDRFEARPLATLLTNMTITFFVLVLVAIPLFIAARRLFLSPLVTMAKAARTFGETGRAPRLSIQTNDEIQELAEAFNTAAVSRMAFERDLVAERARAEQASRAKSEFLANMSHEIRTPMNGVIGMIDLALDTPLDAEQKQYLDTAASSAESLLSIINDILDFSKIEAGKLDLDPSEFALADGIADGLAALALKADRSGVEMSVEIGSDVPDSLVGDLGRLRQIIVNLVGNAIKFTEKGEVVLRVEAESRSGNDVVLHFAVRDTGIGIPKDKQALIFEAFSQADGSTTRQFGGTGLGLSISSRLVSMMNGRIWVESEPGVGSVFHFTAAFGIGTKSWATHDSPAVSLDGVKVLVVDDNGTNRRILHAMLSRWGMRPKLAASGAEALDLLDADNGSDRFGLLLVDAVMPEMDGFSLIERIRQKAANSNMLILMLSSSSKRDAIMRCRELGVSLYLTKPVRQSELRQAITAALSAVATGIEGQQEVSLMPEIVNDTPLRILLAEDNAVNQRVASSLLERRGHTVVCATNGVQALAMLDDSIDLVLMDIQMPEMGGFEATAAIREREAISGRHVPIIALTARAMKGDREECLAAGMDDYLSKPIRPAELYAVIGRISGRSAAAIRVEESSQASGANADVLMSVVGNNTELLSDLVSMFADESVKLLEQIGTAIDEGDDDALESAAHTLKGSSATLAGSAASETAAQLELLGRTLRSHEGKPLYLRLSREVASLNRSLEHFVLRRAG